MSTVKNMTNRNGRAIPNQFIIQDGNKTIFQSYNSTIVIEESGKKTILGPNWDCSHTTGKYRNQFLGETKKETEKKIKDGTYILNNSL